MLLLLAIPVFVAVTAFHRYLAIYAPSNILIRRARSTTPRWRTVVAFSALACLLVGAVRAIELGITDGLSAAWYLVALVLVWDAIKVGAAAIREGAYCLILCWRQRNQPDKTATERC